MTLLEKKKKKEHEPLISRHMEVEASGQRMNA
jgi:hypothetical protein